MIRGALLLSFALLPAFSYSKSFPEKSPHMAGQDQQKEIWEKIVTGVGAMKKLPDLEMREGDAREQAGLHRSYENMKKWGEINDEREKLERTMTESLDKAIKLAAEYYGIRPVPGDQKLQVGIFEGDKAVWEPKFHREGRINIKQRSSTIDRYPGKDVDDKLMGITLENGNIFIIGVTFENIKRKFSEPDGSITPDGIRRAAGYLAYIIDHETAGHFRKLVNEEERHPALEVNEFRIRKERRAHLAAFFDLDKDKVVIDSLDRGQEFWRKKALWPTLTRGYLLGVVGSDALTNPVMEESNKRIYQAFETAQRQVRMQRNELHERLSEESRKRKMQAEIDRYMPSRNRQDSRNSGPPPASRREANPRYKGPPPAIVPVKPGIRPVPPLNDYEILLRVAEDLCMDSASVSEETLARVWAGMKHLPFKNDELPQKEGCRRSVFQYLMAANANRRPPDYQDLMNLVRGRSPNRSGGGVRIVPRSPPVRDMDDIDVPSLDHILRGLGN